MGTVYREIFAKPLPAGAKTIVRKGQRLAGTSAVSARRQSPRRRPGWRNGVAKIGGGTGVWRSSLRSCAGMRRAENS